MSRQPTVDDASYLLLDSIGERLCAAWPLLHSVPTRFSVASNQDYISYAAQFAECTFEEAQSRLLALNAAGILHDDGTVDDTVLTYLRRRGAIRIGKVSEGGD
jgi:hypothetical protein